MPGLKNISPSLREGAFTGKSGESCDLLLKTALLAIDQVLMDAATFRSFIQSRGEGTKASQGVLFFPCSKGGGESLGVSFDRAQGCTVLCGANDRLASAFGCGFSVGHDEQFKERISKIFKGAETAG